VEFLAASGMSLWQVLPLVPTHADGSPYNGLSTHAGNRWLISLPWLGDRGLLKGFEPSVSPDENPRAWRDAALRHAGTRFRKAAPGALRETYMRFVEAHAPWLEDFALYSAIRVERGGAPWWEWPRPLRDREPQALEAARARLAAELDQVRFEQFVFFTQWAEIRDYAHEHGVLLFGDLPIYTAHDSAEVWAHREYFEVDEAGRPIKVAGVPPDYFSEQGQLWGNPLYRWERLRADGFGWWVERMRTQLELFDIVRIDHFRGLRACWEIPAGARTAAEGRWVEVPGEALLERLTEVFGELPLVAEDLGTITPDVTALRRRFGIPGMAVLQFAFDGDPRNAYLPHNLERATVPTPAPTTTIPRWAGTRPWTTAPGIWSTSTWAGPASRRPGPWCAPCWRAAPITPWCRPRTSWGWAAGHG
jgi:4-alpha-glucanotransferase